MSSESGIDQKLTKYDINGKPYASSVFSCPPPEQDAKVSHWMCQVNGITSGYNITNNLEPNPFNKGYRDYEVGFFSRSKDKDEVLET